MRDLYASGQEDHRLTREGETSRKIGVPGWKSPQSADPTRDPEEVVGSAGAPCWVGVGGPQTPGSSRVELLCHGSAPKISPSNRTQGVPFGPRRNRVWGACPDSAVSPTLAGPTLQLVAPSPSP